MGLGQWQACDITTEQGSILVIIKSRNVVFCTSFFLNGSMVSFGNKYALVAHILHKNKNGLNGSNFDLIANI